MKEKLKRKKGITLIALVITIIVLLILAGVSIAMLTGDNGILTQAQNASRETDKAGIIEDLKLKILEKQMDGEPIYKDDIKTILNDSGYFTEIPADITLDTELTTTQENGNHTIKVSEIYGGNLTDKPITAGDLSDDEKKELYGKYVTNYECASNSAIVTETEIPGKWMIFNVDENNIYLIASDYITSVPEGKAGGKPSVGSSSSYPRGVSFSNILNDYTDEDGDGQTDISDIGKQLNKSYFTDNNYKSTKSNMKSVAYMLDTNAWSGFKGDEAEYAIGGPTIELFFEAYNKAHGTSANQYQARAKSTTGYEITTDGGTTWGNSTSSAGGNYLVTNDPTFVINTNKNAFAMWLASPSAYNAGYVMLVNYGGGVGTNSYDYTLYGFRPLVSLKSEVELRKTGDNTYEIIK